jgi:hypothetical protein
MKQFKFRSGQIESVPSQQHFVPLSIHTQPTKLQYSLHIILLQAATLKHGSHSGQQNFGTEGLYNVVICTKLKAIYNILLFTRAMIICTRLPPAASTNTAAYPCR